MKQLLAISILTIFFACSCKEHSDKTTGSSIIASKDSIRLNTLSKVDTTNRKSNNLSGYEISTYDNPEFSQQIAEQGARLKQLSDKKVFAAINTQLIAALSEKHRQYLRAKPDYELLAFAKGALFKEDSNDCAFIVYGKKKLRVSILVYNDSADKYFELFGDMKVENGLEAANCNYSAFGTLDYKLADQLDYQEESLLKNTEANLDAVRIKIADISKDGDFILKSGCFSKKVSNNDLPKSLCIATSSVYNNWECLKYDKATNTFFIFYGQAFAD